MTAAMAMTKEELKTALVNHGIDASGSIKKDDLVALYEEYVEPQSKGDFSCDDDEEIALSNLKKSPKKGQKVVTPGRGTKDKLTEDNSLVIGDFDVSQLTDDQLAEALIERGLELGPIVDSTRKFYRKKLAMAIREDSVNGENGVENGGSHEENGVKESESKELQNGEFSADDEEVINDKSEDDDRQPAVNKKVKNQPVTVSKTSSPLSSLRQRFMGTDANDTSERFTPTPRRSIHSYKVTETTKQTMTKKKDGTISQDFDYKKETSESKGILDSRGRFATLLRILPGFFLFLIGLVLAYYIYTKRK